MAWTNSKPFASLALDAFNNTQAFDLTDDTIKAALFNNSVTPDAGAAETATRYNTGTFLVANEQDDGTEWDAGGEPLATKTLTQSTNVVTFDAADTASGGSSATLADVFGALLYDDTLANDPGVGFTYFGGTNSVTNGTFTIVWSASGIYTWTS